MGGIKKHSLARKNCTVKKSQFQPVLKFLSRSSSDHQISKTGQI